MISVALSSSHAVMGARARRAVLHTETDAYHSFMIATPDDPDAS